jgi:uncharacterized membrane protein
MAFFLGENHMKTISLTLNRLFFKGLIVVLPVTLTIYLLMSIATSAENVFGTLIKDLIGPTFYVPGLGILLAVLALIGVGVLAGNFLTGRVIKFGTSQFERLPFLKAIYNPLKDLMSLFGGSGDTAMKKVVLVNFEKLGFRSIGLVTREEFSDLPAGSIAQDNITVYIPMSYMLGGFTAIVPKSSVTEIDMPVEKALKLAITGWVKADPNAN